MWSRSGHANRSSRTRKLQPDIRKVVLFPVVWFKLAQKGRTNSNIMNTNRFSISAALIVVLCFFLPWIQVSCGGSENRLSGVDLARDVHTELWIIPLLMIAVLFVNAARAWREQRTVVAIVNLIGGAFSGYLMNRERSRADHPAALLQVSITGWFWLGFAATIALVILACAEFLRKRKT